MQHTEGLEQAKAFWVEIKAQHPNARHHCWAAVAGKPTDSQQLGFSDDGEPAGTAGKPMLSALLGSQVGEISAVVVRYYGGIKLGAGGLIRAYSGAASSAVQNAKKVEEIAQLVYNITYKYDLVGQVESYLRKNGTIINTIYDNEVTTAFSCNENLPLQEDLQNISKGTAMIECIEKTYKEVDL